MYPHRIRLRGPWECEQIAPGDAAETHSITLPCRLRDAGLGHVRGIVRLRRRFGFPGRLDAFERVWLTFAGVEGPAEISLNAQNIGSQHTTQASEYEVTALLRARNELVVDLSVDSAAAGLWGLVALEVRCTAYLRNLAAQRTRGTWQTSGEVVGVAERPLDLYVLVNGKTAAYSTIEPTPQGRVFQFSVAEPATIEHIKVELVNGGVAWYTAEGPVVHDEWRITM